MTNTHKSHQAAQLRLAAYIIEGDLPWEYSHDGNEWKTPVENASPASAIGGLALRIRLVPSEKRVPLTAADVLPGTVFKLEEYEAAPWFTPLHVLDSHVCMFDSRRAFDVNWQTLSDDWTMRLPGETQWQPCRKSAQP